MSVLSPENFREKLYNRLPKIYRAEDEHNNLALKRYLNALSDGGFAKTIEELNGLLNIVDPEKTPSNVLPFLFHQYGVTPLQGVDEQLLRKMLQIISTILERKGSKSTIQFIASLITGCRTVISSSIKNNSYMLKISFEVENQESAIDEPTKAFLESILRDYVPFYWDMTFESYVGYNNEVGSLSVTTEYSTNIYITEGEEEVLPLYTSDNLIK